MSPTIQAIADVEPMHQGISAIFKPIHNLNSMRKFDMKQGFEIKNSRFTFMQASEPVTFYTILLSHLFQGL